MLRNSFFALILGLAFVAGCASEPAPDSGEAIFAKYCATCHQADGAGVEGAFPTLHQTEWTEGDKGRLIRLVLFGMQGPIEIKGVSYNNVMTPHGFLTDEQVAAVLTFVRSNFENDADAVTAEEVALVRAAEGDHELYESSRLYYRIGIPEADSTAN